MACLATRSENGYHINNLHPWADHQLNPVDFENAMAYYDLAGNRDGLPELHVRHVYWPAGDLIWRPNPSMPVNEIVYSWRVNSSPRLTWDFKLSLAGVNEITTQVGFADFDLQIVPYEDLPSWVVGRSWVNQTFVVPETSTYVSSEGIYEWSTTEGVIVDITKSDQVVPGSLLAQRACISGSSGCELSIFYSNIAEGLRGEYRLAVPAPVGLYLSPVDGRLHLQGAQGGVLNLGAGQYLRLHNLDRDDTIDGWTLERLSANPEQSGDVLAGLFRLGDRYLLFDGQRTRLYTAAAPASLLELLPPTDSASWDLFRQRLAGAQPKDPLRLSAWLDGLEDELLQVTPSHAAPPSFWDGAYSFELVLEPGFQVAGRDELALLGRPPGRYLVSYTAGAFVVEPITPPSLVLAFTARPDDPWVIDPIQRIELTAANLGAQDTSRLQVLAQADCGAAPRELLRTAVAVPRSRQALLALRLAAAAQPLLSPHRRPF